MSLIKIAVYVSMCKCKLHGEFVLPDGTKSLEFYSKETAFAELQKLKDGKKVSDFEFTFLRNQIVDSSLCNREFNVNIFAKLACQIDIYSQMLSEISDIVEKDLQAEMDKLPISKHVQ